MICARTSTDAARGGWLALDNLRTWGVQAASSAAFTPGDLNGDGMLDGLDIQPFLTAVLSGTTEPAYLYIADFDSATGGSARGGNSGAVDLADVDSFVTALLASTP